jgi:hypothetical protein
VNEISCQRRPNRWNKETLVVSGWISTIRFTGGLLGHSLPSFYCHCYNEPALVASLPPYEQWADPQISANLAYFRNLTRLSQGQGFVEIPK